MIETYSIISINQIGFGYIPLWLLAIFFVVLGLTCLCCIVIIILISIRNRMVFHPTKKPPTELQAKLAEWDERQREETDDL